VQKIIAETPK